MAEMTCPGCEHHFEVVHPCPECGREMSDKGDHLECDTCRIEVRIKPIRKHPNFIGH